ncbi:hypothetical protein J5J10_13170 [Ciceribacter sp. L1K23]|uniref:hypothetical protein n=1 Tax=unclassified Ciceribacter TaxID=2628820 RepID=UPI001ABDB6F1|nr:MULTISPECIES: hypothetical protein [unclassified Ciceribacter]MBO3759220.1 hypothetical protein [Ciceribacter sp. L1K22]MBR0556632.1 hypothetical protein [Ciceribacter sp. L1K23]
MTRKDYRKDIKAALNTSGGGQLGGTYYGQEPDARTGPSPNAKRKQKPADGKKGS